MKTKQHLVLLLAALLAMTSCQNSQTDSVEETDVEQQDISSETETELKDAVPEDLKFGGADFKFLAQDNYGGASLVEGATGEAYNDAKYNMELYTEERLDVKISEVLMDTWEMPTQVPNLVMSGDASYDAITMMDRHSLAVALEGAFYSMEDIPYVDLDQKYWGIGLNDDLLIDGENYFAISSFNFFSLEQATFVLMNETVAENHDIKVPFEEVFNGTWTQDMFTSYGNIATSDVDGNGIMDDADSYTYGRMDVRLIGQMFLYASGCKFIDIDENDNPYVSYLDNEKVIDVLEWTRNIFLTGSDAVDQLLYGDRFESAFKIYELFVNDRELFNVAEFLHLPLLRDMESDFSILPLPKYDESQNRYYSYTHNVNFSMVPKTATDLDKAGAVQEVLCCEGYRNVIPAYIETTLANKMVRNQESAEVVQLVYDTRAYDLGKCYITDYVAGNLWDQLKTSGNSIVSYFESHREPVKGRVQEIVTALGDGE